MSESISIKRSKLTSTLFISSLLLLNNLDYCLRTISYLCRSSIIMLNLRPETVLIAILKDDMDEAVTKLIPCF